MVSGSPYNGTPRLPHSTRLSDFIKHISALPAKVMNIEIFGNEFAKTLDKDLSCKFIVAILDCQCQNSAFRLCSESRNAALADGHGLYY
jgi:hypothetical protein